MHVGAKPYLLSLASAERLHAHERDRSKIFVREKLGDVALLDIDYTMNAVERTRFPVPTHADEQGTKDAPGLVRAADLIG